MQEQSSQQTPGLAAHIAHLVRNDGEFPQAGVTLGQSDYLIDRAREVWHRIHVRKDDGREAMLWYKTNGDRTMVSVRSSTVTYPDFTITEFPQVASDLLNAAMS